MKIDYIDKNRTIAPAKPDYEVWKDEDANQVKEVVNANDDARELISKSGLLTVTVKLDLISGHFVNSVASPITTTIPIDLTSAIQGGDALVWYKGSVIDENTVTGANVLFTIGSNEANKLCIVTIVYDQRSGGVILNIVKGVEGSLPVLPDAPTSLAVGVETDTTIPLTWTKSASGAMSNYRIYIGGSLQQTFGDVALGTLTGLTQNTTYSNITVRAFDGTYESTDSNAVSGTTTGGVSNPPLAPSLGLTETAFGEAPLEPSLGLTETSF